MNATKITPCETAKGEGGKCLYGRDQWGRFYFRRTPASQWKRMK